MEKSKKLWAHYEQVKTIIGLYIVLFFAVPALSLMISYIVYSAEIEAGEQGALEMALQVGLKWYAILMPIITVLFLVWFLYYSGKVEFTDASLNYYPYIFSKTPRIIHYNEVKELYLKLVSEAKDWNDACINGTRNGFIRFLYNHPDSGYEQVCNDKIDSLDFVAALSANTVEAYKLYLDNHPKGLYTDQALQAQEKIDELTVKPEEEIQIEKLCETFFSSLATKNEEILLSTVDNVMDNFLNKKNATHSDIKALSEKLAEGSSNPKTFIVNNDFNIHKSYESSGDLSYNVTFSVNGINSDNQMVEKYAVNVIVGSNMKILTKKSRK